MNQENWKLQTFDKVDYSSVDPTTLLYEMLKYRGIENPAAWLNTSPAYENSPSLLKNIEQVTSILHDAMKNNKRIYIQVD